MKRIDFDTVPPYFDNGEFKWYTDEYLQTYIGEQQAENLPKLQGIAAFVVKGGDITDYVLINDRQEVLASYSYNGEGFDQMQARINIMKVSKHYDKYESANV